MTKELVISSNRHETKVAILEDDQLVEIYFQRSNEYSLAGSIHKGRVTRVLPGMQSAFVDLGLERDTFLYVSDFFEDNDEYDRIAPDTDDRPARSGRRGEHGRESDRSEPPRDFTRVDARVLPTAPEREAAPPPVAEVTAPVESAGVPESVPNRSGDQDFRERGGRRSRRRRSRGRGFPESKYASDVETRPAPAEEEGDEAAEPEEPRDVILLPGESLAKYKRPADREALSEETPVTISADSPEVTSGNGIETAAPEEVLPVRTFETQEFALPSGGGAAFAFATDEPALAEPVEDERFEAGLVSQAELPEPALGSGFPEAGYFVSTPIPESPRESGDLPESIPVRDEGIAEEPEIASIQDEDIAEEVLATLSEQQMEDEKAQQAGAGPSLASVRDQGSRFQHRISRRMRRRGRGGAEQPRGGPDHRDASEHRPAMQRTESPEAAVTSVETRASARSEKTDAPSISELLREGQEIIVQIAKEPLGQKGARITSHIALPGRYVVYMPTVEHLGVSRKVSSEEERQRLKRILQTHRTGISGGFIVRTAGEGHTEDEIAADMAFLYNLWLDIRQKAEKKKAPTLLHHDLEIVQRILRDQLTESFKAVWVDNEEMYESVLRFMQRFQPALVSRIKMYTRPEPIFDQFGVTAEIEKALRPKVWLKSGGYIVINQTEALVAIDVNTGKYIGKSNRLEDTITKTNTEAVREIVRQIRLRDLGGIIVVDFIDMDERKNRQKVMQALEDAMRADRAPNKILQFNDFGLVAITRKRVKQSLERSLCSPCPACEGAGYVKSVNTVVSEILQEAGKLRSAIEGKNVILRTHPDVAKFLKSNTNKYLEELEEILGRTVLVTSDAALHPEKFDLG
jgi:ribonuclease G